MLWSFFRKISEIINFLVVPSGGIFNKVVSFETLLSFSDGLDGFSLRLRVEAALEPKVMILKLLFFVL